MQGQTLSANLVRQKFLAAFKAHGHAIIPSASLVPENDPTVLFTTAGMQPMIPYLLGEQHPAGTRIADSQKCFRSQDIEEVGDNRHTTFFEMLGNWSFGDFFKAEQIPWMFDFLTKDLGLDPKHLYVSVFRGNEALNVPRDNDAVELWQKKFSETGIDAQAVDFSERDGMQNGRIFYYPERKNWWSRAGVPVNMPVGEIGGPDTEMFWDFGTESQLHEKSPWSSEPCHVNCDCGRFMEIGNNVFIQYIKRDHGLEQLEKKNVDFGGGLERIAAAVNNNPDVFLIDLFDSARGVIERLSGKSYGADKDITTSFRVVLDHVRAATFLIGDGVLPSNKDQGYLVRRLIRRAVRFARRLGVAQALLREVSSAFIDVYTEAYQNLAANRDAILSALETEESKFAKSLEQGLKELKRKVEAQGQISGKDAFDLYQSYGFPLELTIEELQTSHNLTVDTEQFKDEFRKHQDLSRTGSEQKFAGGLADHSERVVRMHTATHLLHQALRTILGPHVEQKGSNITSERLRFDFSHPDKMTPEQIKAAEDMVNEQITRDLPVAYKMLSVTEAKELGAIGLFEDKYAQLGDSIKVYIVGSNEKGYFSKEICGGPHVEHTALVGKFKILKEEASSAGIRRIKAVVE
jgi:alanyl-tRNA synthetase